MLAISSKNNHCSYENQNQPIHASEKPKRLGCIHCTAPTAQSAIVFSSDFDSVIPAEITAGTALITPVQGYSGLGPSGNIFAGSFLRSQTANVVTLKLTGLPAHDTVSLSLLFAAIDSLDGTGNFPQGDFFQVTLDNVMIFNESFANATPPVDPELCATYRGGTCSSGGLGIRWPGWFLHG